MTGELLLDKLIRVETQRYLHGSVSFFFSIYIYISSTELKIFSENIIVHNSQLAIISHSITFSFFFCATDATVINVSHIHS